MKAYVVDNDQSAGVRFADVPDPNLAPNEVWRGSWKQLPDAITLVQTRTISGKAVLRVD